MAVIFLTKLLGSLFYATIIFIAAGGVISNFLSVWRIDRRISMRRKDEEGRSAAKRFLFFQLLLVQLLFLTAVASGHLLFSSQILVTVYGRRIDLYVLLLIGLGFYLYSTVLNSKPITWYITGQPFWLPTKEILIVPLAKTKKFLSIYRLVLWTVSSSVIPFYFFWPDMYQIYWALCSLAILVLGTKYKRLDFKFTVNISLEVNTKLKNNLPRPVKNSEDEFDQSFVERRDDRRPVERASTSYSSGITSLLNRVVANRDTGGAAGRGRERYRSFSSEPLNLKAKQTVNRLIQEVIQQRERINREYENSRTQVVERGSGLHLD